MNEKNPCRIDWVTIPAADLETSKEFYSNIFGWKIEDYSPDFLIFSSGTVNGGLDRNKEACSEGINFSITVEDISEALEKIVELGGEIVSEKYWIGSELGYSASFKDPNGNHIELWSEK